MCKGETTEGQVLWFMQSESVIISGVYMSHCIFDEFVCHLITMFIKQANFQVKGRTGLRYVVLPDKEHLVF